MRNVDIVVPFYNEEIVIPMFFRELALALEPLRYNFKVIAINDGSTDDTEKILTTTLQSTSKNSNHLEFKVINFSRNFGHQSALIAGLLSSKGDCVISMDGDLQHPPKLISSMIAKWEEGFDVVQTVRTSTEGVSFFKKSTSALFYNFVNRFTNLDINKGSSDFRLLSRNANRHLVNLFNKWSSRDFLLRIVIPNFGFKTSYIEFNAPSRIAGTSHFSLNKMSKLFIAAMISYTKFPILAVALGTLTIQVISTLLLVVFIFVFKSTLIQGFFALFIWLTLQVLLLILDLGVVYSYKTYREISFQPVFIDKNEFDEN